QQKPFVYQETDGVRQEVESGYSLKGVGRVGFTLGAYDTQRSLIIDPVLAYSTYLGGSANDSGRGIAIDSSGNAYLTGQTFSNNFPLANAIQGTFGGSSDAFVTKLSASGSSFVYSTYLGGSGGDSGAGIAVDSSGNAYVAGQAGSTNFPVTGGAFQTTIGGSADAFITKLNAGGSSLVYSTYVGGSNSDFANHLEIDSAGSAYITGVTFSTNFPTANAIQSARSGSSTNGFVTKLNAGGSALVYSTYLGGTGTVGDDGNGIAVDPAGNAYVTGFTSSTNFPVMNAIQSTYGGGETDAYVAKLNAGGSARLCSTRPTSAGAAIRGRSRTTASPSRRTPQVTHTSRELPTRRTFP
ncbi:MAG TPA: SBBP repeat-containing protein, partial [Pyrinomonadaceae bacterium]|nr:SBBP repeat-containing protein [Pyrinomonadaceae bacterium]